MHAQTLKQLVCNHTAQIIRRAAVDFFALWSASVRLLALKCYIILMCVTYVLVDRQGTKLSRRC